MFLNILVVLKSFTTWRNRICFEKMPNFFLRGVAFLFFRYICFFLSKIVDPYHFPFLSYTTSAPDQNTSKCAIYKTLLVKAKAINGIYILLFIKKMMNAVYSGNENIFCLHNSRYCKSVTLDYSLFALHSHYIYHYRSM